jgi:hypothetical protein
MDRGSAMVETAAADVSITRHLDEQGDTVLVGATLARVGVGKKAELQIGWTPLGRVHKRRRLISDTTAEYTGDVTLGMLVGLRGADGPLALQAGVSIPTNDGPVGSGHWQADVRVPISLPPVHRIEIALTPEIDAAANATGTGRHVAFVNAVGVGRPLTRALHVGVDVAFFDDEAPEGRTHHSAAGLSFAWQARPKTQVDIGSVIDLSRVNPHVEIYAGLAHQF